MSNEATIKENETFICQKVVGKYHYAVVNKQTNEVVKATKNYDAAVKAFDKVAGA